MRRQAFRLAQLLGLRQFSETSRRDGLIAAFIYKRSGANDRFAP